MKLETLKKYFDITEIKECIGFISQEELVLKIMGLKSSTIVSLYMRTVPTLNKTYKDSNGVKVDDVNPFYITKSKGDHLCRKFQKQNGFFETIHANWVKNKVEKKSGERPEYDPSKGWGEHKEGSKTLHSHVVDGEYREYLNFCPKKQLSRCYVDLDGNPIKTEYIEKWKPQKTYSRKQVDVGLEESEQIPWIKVKVKNVIALKIDKVLYVIRKRHIVDGRTPQ